MLWLSYWYWYCSWKGGLDMSLWTPSRIKPALSEDRNWRLCAPRGLSELYFDNCSITQIAEKCRPWIWCIVDVGNLASSGIARSLSAENRKGILSLFCPLEAGQGRILLQNVTFLKGEKRSHLVWWGDFRAASPPRASPCTSRVIKGRASRSPLRESEVRPAVRDFPPLWHGGVCAGLGEPLCCQERRSWQDIVHSARGARQLRQSGLLPEAPAASVTQRSKAEVSGGSGASARRDGPVPRHEMTWARLLPGAQNNVFTCTFARANSDKLANVSTCLIG